ncbi:hypothetical protein ABZ705_26530 [Streptomyces sp. NPDC006984]|uniref:hypothetical protein n=1 Tax=Streptomyces sp. NPDC006984 TaxID=3155463 RepID=UPI0033D22B29
MSDNEQQQPAPGRGKVLEALARAERKVFTRPRAPECSLDVRYDLMRGARA